MTNFYIDFNPDVSDFNQLISLLDSHGFYNNVTQPHDRIKICKSFQQHFVYFIYLKCGSARFERLQNTVYSKSA